jgi:hypothetical protein
MVWHSRIVDRAGSPGLYPAHTRTTALDVIIDGAELSQDNGCSGREGREGTMRCPCGSGPGPQFRFQIDLH